MSEQQLPGLPVPRSFFAGIAENCTECVAQYRWIPDNQTNNQLTLSIGDIIIVIERTNNDWWYGELNGLEGYFPTNYVRARWDQFIDEQILQQRILISSNPKKYKDDILKETFNHDSDSNQDQEYFDGYNTVVCYYLLSMTRE